MEFCFLANCQSRSHTRFLSSARVSFYNSDPMSTFCILVGIVPKVESLLTRESRLSLLTRVSVIIGPVGRDRFFLSMMIYAL